MTDHPNPKDPQAEVPHIALVIEKIDAVVYFNGDELYRTPKDKEITMGGWPSQSNAPPQAELEQILNDFGNDVLTQASWVKLGGDVKDASPYLDKILALFQAREQQLLTELLEQKVFGRFEGLREDHWAIPVSVIERLQNKTNDGGQNGD